MAFTLQQIVVPVAVLGSQADRSDWTDWQTYFNGLLDSMRAAMPCKGFVRLSEDMAERVFGENLPLTDPADPLPLLSQSSTLAIYLDRTLPSETVRLE